MSKIESNEIQDIKNYEIDENIQIKKSQIISANKIIDQFIIEFNDKYTKLNEDLFDLKYNFYSKINTLKQIIKITDINSPKLKSLERNTSYIIPSNTDSNFNKMNPVSKLEKRENLSYTSTKNKSWEKNNKNNMSINKGNSKITKLKQLNKNFDDCKRISMNKVYLNKYKTNNLGTSSIKYKNNENNISITKTLTQNIITTNKKNNNIINDENTINNNNNKINKTENNDVISDFTKENKIENKNENKNENENENKIENKNKNKNENENENKNVKINEKNGKIKENELELIQYPSQTAQIGINLITNDNEKLIYKENSLICKKIIKCIFIILEIDTEKIIFDNYSIEKLFQIIYNKLHKKCNNIKDLFIHFIYPKIYINLHKNFYNVTYHINVLNSLRKNSGLKVNNIEKVTKENNNPFSWIAINILEIYKYLEYIEATFNKVEKIK